MNENRQGTLSSWSDFARAYIRDLARSHMERLEFRPEQDHRLKAGESVVCGAGAMRSLVWTRCDDLRVQVELRGLWDDVRPISVMRTEVVLSEQVRRYTTIVVDPDFAVDDDSVGVLPLARRTDGIFVDETSWSTALAAKSDDDNDLQLRLVDGVYIEATAKALGGQTALFLEIRATYNSDGSDPVYPLYSTRTVKEGLMLTRREGDDILSARWRIGLPPNMYEDQIEISLCEVCADDWGRLRSADLSTALAHGTTTAFPLTRVDDRIYEFRLSADEPLAVPGTTLGLRFVAHNNSMLPEPLLDATREAWTRLLEEHYNWFWESALRNSDPAMAEEVVQKVFSDERVMQFLESFGDRERERGYLSRCVRHGFTPETIHKNRSGRGGDEYDPVNLLADHRTVEFDIEQAELGRVDVQQSELIRAWTNELPPLWQQVIARTQDNQTPESIALAVQCDVTQISAIIALTEHRLGQKPGSQGKEWSRQLIADKERNAAAGILLGWHNSRRVELVPENNQGPQNWDAFVRWQGYKVTLPKGSDPAMVSLEQALSLLAPKIDRNRENSRQRRNSSRER